MTDPHAPDTAPPRGRRPVAQTALAAAWAVSLALVGSTVAWLSLADMDDPAAAPPEVSATAEGQGGHAAAPAPGSTESGAPAAEAGHGSDGHAAASAPGSPETRAPAAGAGHGSDGHAAAPAPDSTETRAPAAGAGHGSDGHAAAASVPHGAPAPAGGHGDAAASPTVAPARTDARAAPTLPGVVEAVRTPLAPAPDPAITTRGQYGPLPLRAADGKVAWRTYGRPFEAPPGRPRIAIIVSNMGLAEQPTLAAIQDLPGEITLAFSPYSSRLAEWVPAARAAGHEVLLQVPMEPRNTEFEDPGERALMVGDTPEVNIDRLEWVLSRAVGYVGVMNFMGSRLTVSPRDLQPVLDSVDARGLLFVDARTAPETVAGKMAGEIGLPTVTSDRTIDIDAARGPIDDRLAQLEQIALTRQVAVGIAGDYPVTIERLRHWIDGLSARGFALAPVSAVVRFADSQ